MLKFSVYKVLLIVFLIFYLPLIGDAKTDLEEALKYYPLNTGDIRK